MLLFQQRGTELTIAELDAVTYSATGLRETKRFYRSAISGLIVDPQQQEALLLQTAPQMAFFKFQIRGTEMIPVCNSTLWSTSNDLILNVWNVFPLERHGSLIAVAPSASGFNTTVLVVKPDDGMVTEVFSVAGAPIRGISTIDRDGERYFFAVSRGGERQVVVHYPESGSAEEWSLDWGDIVGLHYDNAQCRLLAFYLRGASKINVQALRFASPASRSRLVSTSRYRLAPPNVSLIELTMSAWTSTRAPVLFRGRCLARLPRHPARHAAHAGATTPRIGLGRRGWVSAASSLPQPRLHGRNACAMPPRP